MGQALSTEPNDMFPDFTDQKSKIDETSESLCNSKTMTGEDSHIAVTGRSKDNYDKQLFPDIKNTNLFLKDKDYLDIACGLNHINEKSLLSNLSGDKYRHGLDIHDLTAINLNIELANNIKYTKGSVYDMSGLPKYDVITCNNFLYFWELDPKKILKALQELSNHLKKDGEIRIFPIYYGNYSLNYIPLHKFLNENFWISCLQPEYSDEAPLLYRDNETHKASGIDGRHEKNENKELMSHTLILKRKSKLYL
jgi:hypothetical protein